MRRTALRPSDFPARNTTYGGASTPAPPALIPSLVPRIVVGPLAGGGFAPTFWHLWWPATLIVLYGYFLFVVFSMKAAYRSLILGTGYRAGTSAPGGKVRPLRNAWAPRTANGRK